MYWVVIRMSHGVRRQFVEGSYETYNEAENKYEEARKEWGPETEIHIVKNLCSHDVTSGMCES